MSESTTLRDLVGLGHEAAPLAESALIMVDCQNTYRQGLMQLEGVEAALQQARAVLERARDLKVPVVHIQHDGGIGSPYDVTAEIGAIADVVAPISGERLVVKNYPNAFIKTDLDEILKAEGIKNIVLVGFMTHMCINSTAHGGFNLGYTPSVVASATATRALPGADGNLVSAKQVHEAALASTRDLYAAVLNSVDDLH